MFQFKERHIARLFLGGLFLLAVFFWLASINGEGNGFSFLLPCPFRAVTGIPCPGCGMTRACLAVTQGDASQAFHFHPLVFGLLAFVLLASIFPDQLRRYWFNIKARNRTVIGGVLLFLVLGTWLLRLFTDTIP